MNKAFQAEINNTGMSENLTIFVEEVDKKFLCVVFHSWKISLDKLSYHRAMLNASSNSVRLVVVDAALLTIYFILPMVFLLIHTEACPPPLKRLFNYLFRSPVAR